MVSKWVVTYKCMGYIGSILILTFDPNFQRYIQVVDRVCQVSPGP